MTEEQYNKEFNNLITQRKPAKSIGLGTILIIFILILVSVISLVIIFNSENKDENKPLASQTLTCPNLVCPEIPTCPSCQCNPLPCNTTQAIKYDCTTITRLYAEKERALELCWRDSNGTTTVTNYTYRNSTMADKLENCTDQLSRIINITS